MHPGFQIALFELQEAFAVNFYVDWKEALKILTILKTFETEEKGIFVIFPSGGNMLCTSFLFLN